VRQHDRREYPERVAENATASITWRVTAMNAPGDARAARPKTPLVYLWTCPCHIPILVAVLSGTAFGALLRGHLDVALAVATILFLAFVAAALRSWTHTRCKRIINP